VTKLRSWLKRPIEAWLIVIAVAALLFGTAEVIMWNHSHLVLAIVGLAWGVVIMFVVWMEG